jgi:hypothetical protein
MTVLAARKAGVKRGGRRFPRPSMPRKHIPQFAKAGGDVETLVGLRFA